jgi:hypothetical protein
MYMEKLIFYTNTQKLGYFIYLYTERYIVQNRGRNRNKFKAYVQIQVFNYTNIYEYDFLSSLHDKVTITFTSNDVIISFK